MDITKGDTVKIIQGKDRGKKGKVIQIFLKEKKVVVDRLNLKVKNVRPKKAGEKGERVKFASPMDISNVMLVCSKCSKTVRAGYKMAKDKKLRICKKCNKQI